MMRINEIIKEYYLLFLVFYFTSANAQDINNYRCLLKDSTVKIEKTNLPIVFISVGKKMIQYEDYILAQMKIIYNGEGEYNYGDTILHPNQLVDYEGCIALRYRGHSSFINSDKKPYAFRTLKDAKLPSEGGKKEKVSLLGMRKDSKWAFLAPWADRSMIRDVLSFELARPWMDFVPETRFCELILDGTYYGVFILTERVSSGKNRLNLSDSNDIGKEGETDILVYVDRGDAPYYQSNFHPYGANGIVMDKTVKYEYKFPDPKDFSVLPLETNYYIDREINRMEEVFATGAYEKYKDVIDVTSFIDYMLSTEVSNNIDGYRLSTYLYKYSPSTARKEGYSEKWKMALWDFNFAWGNTKYNGHVSNTIWHYNINFREDYQNDLNWVPFYWHKMLKDDKYVSLLKLRWKQYRISNHSIIAIYNKIDSLTNILVTGGGISRNENAWRIFDTSIWGVGYNVESYEEEISHLKRWIEGRLEFMDKELIDATGIKEIELSDGSVELYNFQGVKLKEIPRNKPYIIKDKGKSRIIIPHIN